jgi:excinuclease ABC subunit A
MNGSGEWIKIRGARTHNLQSLSVDLPRDALCVITGPSGSGKSSLAFDTVFAEGRRRYLETLRGDKRALFQQLQRADVDAIEGLPPVVCVSQHAASARPRSTLATVTEIHDHLRLLYARFGTPYCPNCSLPIHKHTLTEIIRAIMSQEGRKIFVLAPLVQDRPGDHKDQFLHIRQTGFVRARVDGVLMEIRDNPKIDPNKNHTIELIVDRLVVKPAIEERLRESLTTATQHGNGRVVITDIETGDWLDDAYSTRYACVRCQASVPDLEPRNFSFNNPHGACPRCTGFGQVWEFDPKLIVPDRSWTLGRVLERLEELAPEGVSIDRRVVKSFQEAFSLDAQTPLVEWPDEAYRALLDGADRGDPAFPGLLRILRAWTELLSGEDGDEQHFLALSGFVPCPECGGARLNREARAVRFAGKGLHEVTALSVEAATAFFAQLVDADYQSPAHKARAMLLTEIAQRLQFLQQVGLGYLTLDRPAPTLSGGEAQRARLAMHLGGGLLGVCYILDEPTMGLHPRDTQRLLDALRGLQARGNTVLVVEHDETVIRQADYLVDIGPGAGRHGGQLVACGTVADVLANPNSVTGKYMNCEPEAPARADAGFLAGASGSDQTRWITIRGARHHNLKDIDASFPVGRWTCLSGVSGSGKSSLARDILCHAARRHFGLLAPTPGAHDRIEGLEQLDKVLEVDQKPLGKTPRSSPATYVGLFDEIRKVFAATRLAKIRGYQANRFSFNVKGGRCEECQGQGIVRVELAFMPDLRVICPACQGKRFNAATLEVRYRGLSIAEVLDLPIEAAGDFFANIPMLQGGLQALNEVGLGYLALGQPANTLFGGEAQRVKLAAELAKSSSGKTLYLFDEPTTGLHFVDVARLIRVFRRLVDAGNTIVVIEHHLDMIAASDWVIDLGPEGGASGGEVVCAGTPRDIAACPRSITGRYLQAQR